MPNPRILICLLLASGSMSAQNLVPNAGFEAVVTCPSGPGQLYLASPWDSLNSSPDIFNGCSPAAPLCSSVGVPNNFIGTGTAHGGIGFAGFTALSSDPDYREYIQAPLNAALVSGEIYRVEAWLRRASFCNTAIQNIGMTLSSGSVTQFGTAPLGFTPPVVSSTIIDNAGAWTLLEGFIVAFGGENNIVIGNFADDASTVSATVPNTGASCPFDGAYYYIDDVRVELVNESVLITGDSIICPGESTLLTAISNTQTWWSDEGDPSQPISNSASITVSPLVTTTYFLNGIFKSDSITVTVVPPPVVSLGNDTTICEGQTVTLDATTNPASTYVWSTGALSASITVSMPGPYSVQVTNEGCTVTDMINLTVLTNPDILLGPDSVFCSLTGVYIELDAGPAESFLWQPTGEITQAITPYMDGMYSVTAQYANGCEKTANIGIREVCEPLVFVPSAFTPNHDGLNDVLRCVHSGIESLEISVFNRWGQLVYYSDDAAFEWDGSLSQGPAPPGTYVYLVRYTYQPAGRKPETATTQGHTTLIR